MEYGVGGLRNEDEETYIEWDDFMKDVRSTVIDGSKKTDARRLKTT